MEGGYSEWEDHTITLPRDENLSASNSFDSRIESPYPNGTFRSSDGDSVKFPSGLTVFPFSLRSFSYEDTGYNRRDSRGIRALANVTNFRLEFSIVQRASNPSIDDFISVRRALSNPTTATRNEHETHGQHWFGDSSESYVGRL